MLLLKAAASSIGQSKAVCSRWIACLWKPAKMSNLNKLYYWRMGEHHCRHTACQGQPGLDKSHRALQGRESHHLQLQPKEAHSRKNRPSPELTRLLVEQIGGSVLAKREPVKPVEKVVKAEAETEAVQVKAEKPVRTASTASREKKSVVKAPVKLRKPPLQKRRLLRPRWRIRNPPSPPLNLLPASQLPRNRQRKSRLRRNRRVRLSWHTKKGGGSSRKRKRLQCTAPGREEIRWRAMFFLEIFLSASAVRVSSLA